MIELTEQQAQEVNTSDDDSLRVRDPRTGECFVLVSEQRFEEIVRYSFAGGSRKSIPSGILRSMEAFWADLQLMLTRWRQRGKFVLYHGHRQIAFARSIPVLEKRRAHLGIADDDYYIGQAVPQHYPPWEPESMSIGLIEFDDDDEDEAVQPIMRE